MNNKKSTGVKPSDRINSAEVWTNCHNNMEVPNADDARREFNAMHYRLDVLECIIHNLNNKTQSPAPSCEHSSIASGSDYCDKCGIHKSRWLKPDVGGKACMCESGKPGEIIDCEYVNGNLCCSLCGNIIKSLKPSHVKKFGPIISSTITEVKPSPAKGRLELILEKSWKSSDDWDGYDSMAKAAVEEVERLINQIGYERFHTALPMYAHNIITALRNELL